MWQSKIEKKSSQSSNMSFLNQNSQMPLVWHETHPAIFGNMVFFFLFSWQKKKLDLFLAGPSRSISLPGHCCTPLALSPLLEQLKLEDVALTRGCSKTFTFPNDALN